MRAALLCLLVGCYTPTPPQGLPCGVGDSCPSNQRCFDGVCRISPPGDDPDGALPDDGVVPDVPNPMSLRFGERSDAIADTMVDTFLISNPTEAMNNFGGHIDLHLTAFPLDPLLFRVDLSAIPSGATVTSATLIARVIFNTVEPGREVQVFEVKESWTEGSGDHSVGVANLSDRHPNVVWSAEGAAPPSRDSIPSSITPISDPLVAGQDLVLDLSTEMIQQWVTDPRSNNGLAVLVVGANMYAELGSSEATEQGDRPILVVNIE